MAVVQAEIKTYLTSGNATGSHKGGAQNDPDTSLGGWTSTTEESTLDGNLWELLGLDDLNASTTYRCIAIMNENATDVLQTCRVVGEFIDDLASGISVEFGIQTNDLTTVAPVCADEETAPTGINFFTPYEDTGVPGTDWVSAQPIGPLNSPQTGTTDLTLSDSSVIFVYIKLTLAAVTASFTGTNNILRANIIGSQA
jgi:hypothetical protein